MQGWEGVSLHGGRLERLLSEGELAAQQPCKALAGVLQVAEERVVPLDDCIAFEMGYPWVLHPQRCGYWCSWDNSLRQGLNLCLSLFAGS